MEVAKLEKSSQKIRLRQTLFDHINVKTIIYNVWIDLQFDVGIFNTSRSASLDRRRDEKPFLSYYL